MSRQRFEASGHRSLDVSSGRVPRSLRDNEISPAANLFPNSRASGGVKQPFWSVVSTITGLLVVWNKKKRGKKRGREGVLLTSSWTMNWREMETHEWELREKEKQRERERERESKERNKKGKEKIMRRMECTPTFATRFPTSVCRLQPRENTLANVRGMHRCCILRVASLWTRANVSIPNRGIDFDGVERWPDGSAGWSTAAQDRHEINALTRSFSTNCINGVDSLRWYRRVNLPVLRYDRSSNRDSLFFLLETSKIKFVN